MIPPQFGHYELWIELAYSLIVVFSCLLIYTRTKELYELTSYKGIRYFRNTFLFFGITYIVRLLLRLTFVTRGRPRLFEPFAFGLFETSFFVMVYASSMALIYLIYSVFWKRIDRTVLSKTYLVHAFALVMAFLSTINKTPFVFLIFQSGLFLMLIIVSWLNYKKTKHKGRFSHLYIFYLLMFALWLVGNVLEFVISFSPVVGLAVYSASIIVFLVILLRVLEKLKAR